jgi:hypothetical protein
MGLLVYPIFRAGFGTEMKPPAFVLPEELHLPLCEFLTM